MMLRQVARESGRDNGRVNGTAPGIMEAEHVANVAMLPPLARQMVEDGIAHTLLPRFRRPTEVADLVTWLLSNEVAYVNGQAIGVDGGHSCRVVATCRCYNLRPLARVHPLVLWCVPTRFRNSPGVASWH